MTFVVSHSYSLLSQCMRGFHFKIQVYLTKVQNILYTITLLGRVFVTAYVYLVLKNGILVDAMCLVFNNGILVMLWVWCSTRVF